MRIPFFSSRGDPIEKVLRDADLDFVRARLIETFAGTILPEKLADGLSQFVSSPCPRTAMALVQAEPSLLDLFATSQQGARFFQATGIPVGTPRPTAATLQTDPGFGDLVKAFVDDRSTYDILASKYRTAGWSDNAIAQAITEHSQDLADY